MRRMRVLVWAVALSVFELSACSGTVESREDCVVSYEPPTVCSSHTEISIVMRCATPIVRPQGCVDAIEDQGESSTTWCCGSP